MTKPKNPAPGQPKRSESLTRMLELEKKYKMQRIQDNGSKPHTPPGPPSTRPPPSAQPDTGVKARRASGHPPPSSHDQIMKAVRRSSGLPSLSISIPPSPIQTVDVTRDGHFDQQLAPAPAPEPGKERSKTVTFSDRDDEDADLSDVSSICHSPSWEGYGQNKKKAKKKEAEKREKERREKESKSASKKKQSRLSKAPPQDSPEVKPLTASDRSASMSELDSHQRLTERNSNRATISHYPPDAMANHPQLKKQATGEENARPRTKSFLSGFRLQHGKVSAVQKMISSTRASMDESQSVKNGIRKSHSVEPAVDTEFANPRKAPKAPSVTTNISAYTNPSQERRPGNGHNNSASGHGCSQSLFSRLRGPSYLYHQGSDSGNNKSTERPGISQQRPGSSWQPESPKPQTETLRPKTSHGPAPPPLVHPAPMPMPRAPKSDTRVLRGRQPEAHAQSSRRDVSSDYEEETRPSGPHGRQPETMVREIPIRDVPARNIPVHDMPVANEGLRRPQSYVEHVRQQFADTASPSIPHPVNDYMEKERSQQYEAQRRYQDVEKTRSFKPDTDHEPIFQSPSSSPDYASGYKDDINRLSATHSPHSEDDQASIGTHSSTIRPISRGKGSMERGRRTPNSTKSPAPSVTRRAMTHGREQAIEEEKPEVTEAPKSARAEDAQKRDTDQKTAKSDKSGDYFTFISESYAPPSLELRSPLDKFTSSPRIEEEPDEDDHHEDHHEDERPTWTRLPQRSPRLPEGESYAANPSVSTKPFANRKLHEMKPQNSPATSARSATLSDSDVPAFERLGIASKAAKILGTHTYVHTAPAAENPSGSTSERSSSIYDEAPPSPSTVTTPASSRPQSRKGVSTDMSRSAMNVPSYNTDEISRRKLQRPMTVDFQSVSKSRSRSRDGKKSSRTTLPVDLDNQGAIGVAFSRREGLLSSPALVSTPTSVTFADVLKEEMDEQELGSKRKQLRPKAQSAIDLPSTSFLPPLKHQSLHAKKNKVAKVMSASLSMSNTPPADLDELHPPRTSSLQMSRNNSSSSQDSSCLVSAGAAYLQEARKAAPVPPTTTSRALRPILSHKNTPLGMSSGSPERKGEPIAKVLVECCSCHFYLDMPSRVYECMAKPDSIVEDRSLGVSAAITTTVKCPWCGHGMSTKCCSGYAAVIYLKEKLHGK